MGADVELLPHGDETEIGEKGITLSGGQKQRTAIARAIYADADLVVMDDPLSALDAHVAKDVFRKCVTEEFADKAVLLVTHQLQFVNQADHIIVMSEGRMVEEGTYDDLVSRQGGNFKALMESYHGEDDEAPAAANVQPPHPAAATGATAAVEEVVVEEAPEEGRIGELTESAAEEKEGAPGTSSAGRSPVDSPRTSADVPGKAKVADMSAVAAGVAGAGAAVVAAKKAEEAKRENTITKEKRAEGAISAKTYITYVKNMGTPALLFALFLMALVERLLSVFTNVWLALWSEKHWDGLSQGDYLAGYAGIGIGQAAELGANVRVGSGVPGGSERAAPRALQSDAQHAPVVLRHHSSGTRHPALH